jgi:hypothetical protein
MRVLAYNSAHAAMFVNGHPSGSGVQGVHQDSNQSGSLGGPTYGVKSQGNLLVCNGAFMGNIGPTASGAPFPRPAASSGWIALPGGDPAETIEIVHNIGGDPEDYVVDMQTRFGEGDDVGPIRSPLCDAGGNDYRTWWHSLSSTSIKVSRLDTSQVVYKRSVRIRIWVIK